MTGEGAMLKELGAKCLEFSCKIMLEFFAYFALFKTIVGLD